MNKKHIKFTFLGGLESFGSHCIVAETPKGIWLIDCGAGFPDDGLPGVDLVVPDLRFLAERKNEFRGIIVTHGHEDHIGAIPYIAFCADIQPKIYARPFALALIERKMDEYGLKADYRTVNLDNPMQMGDVTWTFHPVDHSIPQATSVVLDAYNQRFIFTGDWRAGLEDIDFGKVTALFGDSTNASTHRVPPSEDQVVDAVSDILEDAPGRVFLATFSSNIARVSRLVEAANERQIPVAMLGRSLNQNFDTASEMRIAAPIEYPIESDRLDLVDEALVFLTGTQAEPRAALTRLSNKDHHHAHLVETDTVIMSARRIPGNESGIGRMLNRCIDLGVRVITDSTHTVHTSGHASRAKIGEFIDQVRPKYLVPIHGDLVARRAHADLGEERGVEVIFPKNHHCLTFTERRLVSHEEIESKPSLIVEGDLIVDVDMETVRERRRLGVLGVIAVQVELNDNGTVRHMPPFQSMGVIPSSEDELLEEAREALIDALDEMDLNKINDIPHFVRTEVRRFFRHAAGRKPNVLVFVD